MSYLRPKLFLFVSCLAIFLVLFSIFLFKKNSSQKISSKINIVVSLYPLYDFAKEIGQDKVSVSLLLPPGVEAHSFDPKPNDMIRINQSDIFIYTNKYMEPWVSDLLSGITNKKLSIIDASAGIQLANHGQIDPHVWLDLSNTQTIVDTITKVLVLKDPSNKSFYETNSQNYKLRLNKLDQDYQTGLSHCQKKEIIYGGHYAFGYLASKYNLQYISAQGISPDSEPTAQDLISLVNQIKKNDINYIFYEELSSPKIADVIAQETGANLLMLNSAHNISKDQLAQNLSFITIMENNLSNLRIGLECH